MNYIAFVSKALTAKSTNGSRMSHKGNGTFVYLATEWKKKFGMPLNSRLPDEDVDGIKDALATVITNVAERLCDYDTLTVKENALYARIDKKTGLVVTGARASITAHRACKDVQEERLAIRLRQGTLRRSMEALDKKANWTDKQEERYIKCQAELSRMNQELESLAPMKSSECYDDESEIRAAMIS